MRVGALFRRFGIFGRDRSASAAIEFALVAFPFSICVLGIFEISSLFFASVTLDNGTERVARQIKTGEIQSSNITAAQFKQLLCDEVSVLLSCDQRLQVDVRTYQQFNQASFVPPLNPDGTINMAFQFNPGGAGDVVLVRSFYVWELTVPIFSAFFTNMAGGSFLMSSAAAFRNEPFAAGAGAWNTP